MDLAPSEAVKRVRKWEWQKREIACLIVFPGLDMSIALTLGIFPSINLLVVIPHSLIRFAPHVEGCNANTGCHESTILICAVITALLGILAFFDSRQYTDLLGQARAHNPKSPAEKRDEISEANTSPNNQSGETKVAVEKWLKIAAETAEVM